MTKRLRIKIYTLVLCLAVVFGVSFINTHGQSINSIFGIEEQINLTVSTLNPQVGQDVTASVQATGTNLDNNTITWYVNGVQKTTGVGNKTFTTRVSGVGEPLTIRVRVATDSGDGVERSITLSAQDVDIIWETDTYVPPFYKGKALYSPEGNVIFTAMPNIVNKSGVKVASSNLVYKWTLNDSVLGDKSGYGKNVLFYSGSILAQTTEIQVDVTAPDGTTGEGFISIAPQKTQTILYEEDPLYGVMFNNAITSGFKLKNPEIRIDAYPFFQSAYSKIAPNLTYSWSLNNQPIPTPLQKNSAVFRNANNLTGTSIISVTTENSTHVLQESNVTANLNF